MFWICEMAARRAAWAEVPNLSYKIQTNKQTNINTVYWSQNCLFQQSLDVICLQSQGCYPLYGWFECRVDVVCWPMHFQSTWTAIIEITNTITSILQKTNCYNWCTLDEVILSIKLCDQCQLSALSHSWLFYCLLTHIKLFISCMSTVILTIFYTLAESKGRITFMIIYEDTYTDEYFNI